MGFRLIDHGIESLRQRLREAVSNPTRDIPGAVVCIVNKEGQLIFSEAAGKVGANSLESMTLDNLFWLASSTKLILGIACMQLVERGLLHLDDPNQVEDLCPRLKTVPVLERVANGKCYYVEKKHRITLRMLLSHTGSDS
jgi:CubicO group peptidase (beta-lactamase class C family)